MKFKPRIKQNDKAYTWTNDVNRAVIILSLTGIHLSKQPADFLVKKKCNATLVYIAISFREKFTPPTCVLRRPEPDRLH